MARRGKGVNEEEILNELQEKWVAAEAAQELKRDEWKLDYSYYDTFLVEDELGHYISQQLSPLAFKMIMASVPKIVRKPQTVQMVINRAPSDSEEENVRREEISEKYNDLMRYQTRRMKLKLQLNDYLLNKFIFGTAIAYVRWDDEKVLGENCIFYENVSCFEFFPDPRATHPMFYRWAFRETWHTVEQVMEWVEAGIYDRVGEDLGGKTLKEYLNGLVSPNRHRSDMFEYLDNSNVSLSTYNKEIRVLEYYEYGGRIITLLGDSGRVIARVVDDAFKRMPFMITPHYRMPGQFWGFSEIKHMRPMIDYHTHIRRLRRSNLDQAVNAKFIVDPRRTILSSLVNAPSQIIKGDPEAIKLMHNPPLGPETYREEEIIERDIQELTGINDYSYPRNPARADTATAIDELTDSSNARFDLSTIFLNDYLIEPMARNMLDLNKKNLRPFNFSIQDEATGATKSVTITKEDIKGLDEDWDVMFVSGDFNITEKQDFNQFLQVISTIPPAAEIINWRELVKAAFSSYQIPVYKMLKPEEESVSAESKVQPQAQAQPEQMPPEVVAPESQVMQNVPVVGPEVSAVQEPVPEMPDINTLTNLAMAAMQGNQEAMSQIHQLALLADSGNPDAQSMMTHIMRVMGGGIPGEVSGQ